MENSVLVRLIYNSDLQQKVDWNLNFQAVIPLSKRPSYFNIREIVNKIGYFATFGGVWNMPFLAHFIASEFVDQNGESFFIYFDLKIISLWEWLRGKCIWSPEQGF